MRPVAEEQMAADRHRRQRIGYVAEIPDLTLEVESDLHGRGHLPVDSATARYHGVIGDDPGPGRGDVPSGPLKLRGGEHELVARAADPTARPQPWDHDG